MIDSFVKNSKFKRERKKRVIKTRKRLLKKPRMPKIDIFLPLKNNEKKRED